MIPYKLHHIWLQGEAPVRYHVNYESWEEALKDWEHRVWDEDSLLGLCTDEQVEEYGKVQGLINRVNYLKYILMYNEGGIYADLDSYPLKNIYDLFVQNEVKDINLQSTVMDQRYPFNTPIPDKPFGEYDIILPSRNTLSYYPDGRKAVLLDNPVLMSREDDNFWIEMIDWMRGRTELKEVPHEPYGPYGMTDFVFNTLANPYEQGVLILPHHYLMGMEEPNENSYIMHLADQGW